MDLHLDLATAPGRSLRARLEHALRDAVRSGRLASGTRLPASRELCHQLGVSRGVVVDAYAQLAAEGYLRTHRGGGTSVAPDVSPPANTIRAARHEPSSRFDLSPFRPALSQLPRRDLSAALARVLRETPNDQLGLPEPAGALELRTALAGYLARVRGLRAGPEQIVITTGMRHGLTLIWAVLATRGATRVAVEDPGWAGIRETATAAGLRLVPVPVDDEGLRAAELQRLTVDAAAVAPAHQYPTGAVLSATRRGALVNWARANDRIIVEDDYDAEYRYDHQPIGSLQGLAPEYVIYGGSTSKTLTPSLRIGWIAVPHRLLDPILEVQKRTGTTPAPILQLALADIIERGALDRHLRRQRRRYQQQRAALLAGLATDLPELTVRGAAAGLYVTVELPHDLDEATVLRAARARGIALEGRGTATPALVLGYAALTPAAVKPAIAQLAASLEDARRTRANTPSERAPKSVCCSGSRLAIVRTQ